MLDGGFVVRTRTADVVSSECYDAANVAALDKAACEQKFFGAAIVFVVAFGLLLGLRDLVDIVWLGASRHRRLPHVAARLIMPTAYLGSVYASCSTVPLRAGMPVGVASAAAALLSVAIAAIASAKAFACAQRGTVQGDGDDISMQLSFVENAQPESA